MTSTTPTGAGGLGGLDTSPVVARWGTGNPKAPLVVALHGRGASENSMIELAPWLPHGPVAYAAVRGPVEEGTGFAWFAGRGVGRPEPESLAASMRWFLDWLDTEGDPDRPVILVGFSNGAVFAGALMLSEPHRWAAGVLLHGALPFDAGIPVTRGRLAGMPVFLARGEGDTVVPTELQDRTWEYLVGSSGAPLWAEREPGGHELGGRIVGEMGTWLGERLDWINRHGENPVPDGEDQHWPTIAGGRLPERVGEPAQVSVTTPQQQESQNSPADVGEALYVQLAVLDGVSTGPSRVSVPGARAFLLDRAAAAGPDEAFIVPETGEFAHLHPASDGSLHLALPDALAYDALAKGWAVAHPLAGVRVTTGLVLVFGPRDADELEIVAGIVAASYAYAKG